MESWPGRHNPTYLGSFFKPYRLIELKARGLVAWCITRPSSPKRFTLACSPSLIAVLSSRLGGLWPGKSNSTRSLSLITLLSSRVRLVAWLIHPTYPQSVEIARLSLWPYANHSLDSKGWDMGVNLLTLMCLA